jgi:predicted CopG family antitoxin|tara:strand:- start:44 stop:304 length:261 start_codon:yes stop_codon:yes gene_type:complete
MSRLYNTKNKNPIVIKSIAPTLGTKKTEEFKKKLKNKSRVKKMGGGMMGRRMGYDSGKLVGKQKNIDVAAPFGKITGADFKKLRKK